MNGTRLFLAVSAMGLLSLTIASGQDEKSGGEGHGGPSPEHLLKKLDTNGDGKISLEEWKEGPRAQKDPARAEEMFKQIDTNHDGFITLEELKAHPFGPHQHEHGKGGKGKGPGPSASASPAASASPSASP